MTLPKAVVANSTARPLEGVHRGDALRLTRRQVCTFGLAGLVALALPLQSRSARADVSAAADSARPETPQPREVAFPVTLTDDQGRTVEISSIDTVVACMGSFAKTWELAGGTLAGVTSDALADYDLAQAQNLVDVGDFTAPNLEQIMALEPTLVIMSASSAGKGGKASQVDLVAPLEAAGIPVLTFAVTTFADYLRMLRACCNLTGRDDLYDLNGAQVQARIDAVVEAAAAAREGFEEPPTCLIMTTYSGGTRVSTATSQAGAILADLGGANLADQNPSLLKDFSLEAVLAMDPDFIFALPMGNDPEAAQRALIDQTEANPAWASLTAVAEGRYVALDPALFLYKPLNRWDEAYRAMASALYGDDVLAGLSEPEVDTTAEAGR